MRLNIIDKFFFFDKRLNIIDLIFHGNWYTVDIMTCEVNRYKQASDESSCCL
jgi:hypothetical protein